MYWNYLDTTRAVLTEKLSPYIITNTTDKGKFIMNSQEFIDALFPPDQIGEDLMLLWTMPTKISYWSLPQNKKRMGFRPAVENIATIVHGGGDCYFGLGLVPPSKYANGQRWGTTERADAKQVKAIPALWADIDVVGEGHKNRKHYPETIEKAMELLEKLPIYPSIVVSTGGGIHAYWLFDQLLNTSGQDNNFFGAKLMMQWQSMIQQVFDKNGGYSIDSTHDLSRVLRMPSTVNRKYSPPRSVTVIHGDSANLVRFNLREIDKILTSFQLPEPAKYASKDAFRINRTEMTFEIDKERLDMLFEMEPRARECFMMSEETKRLRKGDNSPSSFEMSLANYAARYGFTDEEIATLLIVFRQKHGLEPKNDKHYEVTVMKARASANATVATERLAETVISPLQTAVISEGRGEDDTDEMLQSISDVIGVQVFTGFKRVLSEPPTYVSVINGEDLVLGGIDVILTERLFQKALADGTKYIMPKIGKNWNVIAQHILNVCIDVAIGYEGTTAGMHISNLLRYFDEKCPSDMSYDALNDNRPLEMNNDGYIYFSAEDYKQWFYITNFERLSRKDFYAHLLLQQCSSLCHHLLF